MVLGEKILSEKNYRYRMKYSDFWRLDPLERIEDVPNLSEIKKELDSIVEDIKQLIEEKNRKKVTFRINMMLL